MTGTGAQDCQSKALITLTVHKLPIVQATSDKTVYCPDETIILSAIGANAYLWSGGVSSNQPFAISIPGNYLYSVIGTDLNGCHTADTITVKVKTDVVMPLQLSTNLSNTNIDVLVNEEISFEAIVNDADSHNGQVKVYYKWVGFNAEAVGIKITVANNRLQFNELLFHPSPSHYPNADTFAILEIRYFLPVASSLQSILVLLISSFWNLRLLNSNSLPI